MKYTNIIAYFFQYTNINAILNKKRLNQTYNEKYLGNYAIKLIFIRYNKKRLFMKTDIATIITCFNRKNKTIACLKNLYKACALYNVNHQTSTIELTVFLTDDGCTDGTADAIKAEFCDKNIHIIKGNGHCYWAGGMRLAWKEALKASTPWEYYLLINDDTIVLSNVFEELIRTHNYVLETTGNVGIYSGITCDINDETKITYGGEIFKSNNKGDSLAVKPSDTPKKVDLTNANILLIPKRVIEKIGIFHKGYIHGCADYDYSLTAQRENIPTFTTAHICGKCEFDHMDGKSEIDRLISMSFNERKKYILHPTHSDKDYLLFIKRNLPKRYIFCWILRKIRLYLPYLYKQICIMRKLENYK